MKYEVLANYRSYLLTTVGLSQETTRTYYNKIDKLIDTQNIDNLNISLIINNLSKIKYKNHFSQSKSALLYFLKFLHITLSNENRERIEMLEKNLHKKYRKLKEVDFKKIENKIKHIRNKKLKLSYQVMFEMALRVSELARISMRDCIVDKSTITMYFAAYRGNKEQVVLKREENEKLFHDLQELIKKTNDNNKVFYSANYLQQKAKTLGFACSDLRKACAKIEYKKTKSKQEVKKKLRHKNIKATNSCLRNKVKIDKN